MNKLLVMTILLGLISPCQLFAAKADYSELFQSNVQDRTGAIEEFVKEVDKGKKVDESLKQAVYKLVEEYEKGTYKYNPQEDPEGLYLWALTSLATKVNDKGVRSFMIKAIGNYHVPKALAAQGDDAVDELLVNMNAALEKNKVTVNKIIDTFILMVETNTISNLSRQKINQQLINIVNEANKGELYAASKSKKKVLKLISSCINEPALEYMSLVKDKAFIPSIKLMLENDQGASKLKYTGRDMREMPKEKRHEYIMKLKEEHDGVPQKKWTLRRCEIMLPV